MLGNTLGRYRILERLGGGGMGTVYRAEDPRLEREVALKVIRDDILADEAARKRFRLEARALSRLLHPNIATLFDLDADGGTDFLVLEYVAGETLAAQLSHGPLPEVRARAIAIEVANALQAAHEQGIVHRDLKPSNIMLTPRGAAKVLDFGLAGFLPGNDPTSQSPTIPATAGLSGTIPYMAPEQIAEQPIDARTDLYALGVVLFEMLAGRRPFVAEDTVALLFRIARDPAPLLRTVAPHASRDLEALVARCLEKAPARRHADAAALAQALRASEAPASTWLAPRMPQSDSSETNEGFRSLLVMPFENRSGDATQDFFADGLTDTLIIDLAQIGALRVISRTSAMRLKGTDRALADIARELAVQYVVEGSALRVQDRVRVTVQLVDALADRTLWAKSLDRDLTDILTLQSEVASAIAEEIRVKVTPAEQGRLQPRGAVNPQAHVAYLRGRHLWNRWDPKSLREAIVCFEEALQHDPRYALAWAGISDAYGSLGTTLSIAPHEAYPKAREAAVRGLALDPLSAELHCALASLLRFEDWDWAQSEREFLRAIELNPGYAWAHGRYGLLLATLGRFSEAYAESMRAVELDPLSLITITVMGDTLFWSRRYEESLVYYQRCHEMDPSFGPGNTDTARSLEFLGRTDEALAMYTNGIRRADGTIPATSGLAIMQWSAGRHDEARATLAAALERAKHEYVGPFGVACAYVTFGQHADALDWLDAAFAARDSSLMFIKVHPRLDPLRGEPRFRELLTRMRLD